MIAHDTLKKVSLFEGFTDAELKTVLAKASEKDLIAGESVFDEGSPALSLYVVLDGTIEIKKRGAEDEQKIAAFAKGSVIGEMAMLDRAKRAAGAVARENSKLLELSFENLEQALSANKDAGLKFYRALALTLCKRIRLTTVDLAQLKDMKLKTL